MDATRAGFASVRWLVIGASVGAFAAARALASHVHGGPVLCVLQGLFGVPCPGCGLTRAFCALAVGDVGAALRFNACALPLALLLLGASVVASFELVRGERLGFYQGLWSRGLLYGFAGLFVLHHLGRCAYWISTGALRLGSSTPAWL